MNDFKLPYVSLILDAVSKVIIHVFSTKTRKGVDKYLNVKDNIYGRYTLPELHATY